MKNKTTKKVDVKRKRKQTAEYLRKGPKKRG